MFLGTEWLSFFLLQQEHIRRVERIKKQTPVYEIPRTERSVTVILNDFQKHKAKLGKSPRKNASEQAEDEVGEENQELEHLEEEEKQEDEMNSHRAQRNTTSPVVLRREKTFKTSLEI